MEPPQIDQLHVAEPHCCTAHGDAPCFATVHCRVQYLPWCHFSLKTEKKKDPPQSLQSSANLQVRRCLSAPMYSLSANFSRVPIPHTPFCAKFSDPASTAGKTLSSCAYLQGNDM